MPLAFQAVSLPSTSPLRTVVATRYVLPLREGGSLPGLLEADDLGTYVVKFHGAGQGRKALVAEVIAAELARRLGLLVPELVLVDLDPELARTEPDEEIQDLLEASGGLNLGVDYLPGSLGFDPAVDDVDPASAAAVVWFDALVQNVDRSWRNPNLLRWHGRMWLIDHGAALYFHHNLADHVLLRVSGPLPAADAALAPLLPVDVVRPPSRPCRSNGWMTSPVSPPRTRCARPTSTSSRLACRDAWVPPLEDARAYL